MMSEEDDFQVKNLDGYSKKNFFYYTNKRIFDVLGGIIGLTISAIPIAIFAVIIKKDGGPAFYTQRRIGLHGKSFVMYKLRSMIPDADLKRIKLLGKNEKHDGFFKIKRDPRVTKIGHFLRGHSLDELPQFWNVLKGDMSLVGPRPPLHSEVEKYNDYQIQRLLVRPGMSGLWQISGRSNLDFEDMVALDLKYINERSTWGDIKICFKTITVIFKRGEDVGAY
ncbi:sugar transferase [Oenococcus oeni]|uniref:sugar transferase n=1 Tax=Oenococcus oeni TaxID=1247 RepID=UPI0010B76C08|nr:sugar transferase [Oenococcus oeni]SYW14865.1 putative Galactosyl transferase (Exopolysaccharide production exoY) [Oenococcus oeni]